MNNLSRNKPVALVVGAAGFIGSSLIDELLSKGIQVLGIDEEGTNHDNLSGASKDKNFQLISRLFEGLQDIELIRLDYAVFVVTESERSFKFQQGFKTFLNTVLKYNSKIILCSSINLYESNSGNFDNLKYAEDTLAGKALPEKINARIVRLAATYGPRMDFHDSDPMVKLIKSAIVNKLNQEPTPLEFTTRALYIKDAVNLLIKAIMHGSTAQKIYDGVAHPVKISEIKQVLMDPLWYEEKGFKPTQLPPWPTPNLNKTRKELSWSPETDIVIALKETLAYFNSHQDKIPPERGENKKIISLPVEEGQDGNFKPEAKKSETKYSSPKINTKTLKDKIILFAGITVIFYALIFPIFNFVFASLAVKTHFENSINLMTAGDFDLAEKESGESQKSAAYLNKFIGKFIFIKQIDLLKNPYEVLEQTLKITQKATEANNHTITGAKLLASSLAVISGEKEGDTVRLLYDAQTEFKTADSEIGEVSANLADNNFTSKLPGNLQRTLRDLQSKSESYRGTISLGRSLADLLPGIIAIDAEKSYLVILQDNRILRPGGGLLKAYAEVSFSHGKLVKIVGNSVENLDRQFADRIDPPPELKTDLGETNWRMREASFDLDFPTSARNIVWFYNKESGHQVSGVVALDFLSASRLLQAIGPLKISSSNDEITNDNLSLKIPLGREGNESAAETLKVLVERIFYLSKQNWVILAKNSGESLSSKNLLVYLTDPTAFSYLVSNNWTGKVSKQEIAKIGERNNSLTFSETNISQGQDSSAVERAVSLVSKIDGVGTASHKLSFNFTATEKMLGKYRSRFKIYLPPGTKLIRTSWGDKPVSGISSFSDYGLQGSSMVLELNVGEQKQLVMEYQDINPVKFDNKQLIYRLSIFKQPGQQSFPIDFKLSFPPEVKASSDLQSSVGEVSIKSDLSKDRTFEVILKQ